MSQEFPQEILFEYDIKKIIGEGSNGETWLAQSRRTNELVAIKSLKVGLVSDLKAFELFEREARLLQSVTIPGVPKFYKYVVPQQDSPGYIVQEYIPSPSLQVFLDNDRFFDEAVVLDIATKVTEILLQLETAYSPPIIHRDIKPSNILYHAEKQSVYLIDFGSVANPEKRSSGSTVAGTFGYMPPEQILGEVEVRSDFYALGATMLHLLSGVHPTEMPSNVYQIDVPRVVAAITPKISVGLEELLCSLLSADKTKRPQNAYELLMQLRDVKSGKKRKNSWSMWLHTWLEKVRLRGKRSESGAVNDQPIDENGYYTLRDIQVLSKQKKAVKCDAVVKFWIECDGVVRRYVTLEVGKGVSRALEYSYEIDGRLYSGYCKASEKTSLELPVKCKVLYDPMRPKMSALEYIGE